MIQAEGDLERFCQEFDKHHHGNPLTKYNVESENLLNGQWLPILKEARHYRIQIKTEIQFEDFLKNEWTGKDKWMKARNEYGLKLMGINKPK